MSQSYPVSLRHVLRELDIVTISSLALAMLLLCGVAAYLGCRLVPQLPFVVVFFLCLFGIVPLVGLLLIKTSDSMSLGQAIFICDDSDPHWFRRLSSFHQP